MARSNTASIEAKARNAETKSEGMRMLLSAGRSIADVAKFFDAPYAFVYGVAKRANGGNPPTGAQRRQVKANAKRPVQSARKAAAKTTKVAKVAASAARERKVAAPARKSPTRKAAPVVAAAKPGRPSAARRAANRATRKATVK